MDIQVLARACQYRGLGVGIDEALHFVVRGSVEGMNPDGDIDDLFGRVDGLKTPRHVTADIAKSFHASAFRGTHDVVNILESHP